MTLRDGTRSPDDAAPLSVSRSWVVAVAAVLCLVPLVVTPVLPLIDFYAHVARYYVLGNVGEDPWLAENYVPSWRLLPNLGLDVLGAMVMAVLPPLLGAKILAMLVILAPFFGALSLCRALHGRVDTLNVALAGLLSFSFILSWGFANFILGLGLGLWALGVWIATATRPGLQLALGVVLGTLIMLVHGLVFGLWGLLLGCVEIMLIRAAMPLSVPAVLWRLLRLLIVAALPVAIFVLSKTASAEEGVSGAFANLGGYVQNGGLFARLADEVWQRVDSFLRVAESSYPVFDRVFGVALWGVLLAGYLSGALRLDPRLWLATALAGALIFVMPPNLFGVGHLDERMPLLLLALLAAGTSLSPAARGRTAGWAATLPILGSALFVAHIGMVSVGWARDGQTYRRFLEAAEDVRPGGLAHAVYFGDMRQRDLGRHCKPLLFLLLLQNRTSVSTFANPTQQPLGLTGPLKQALAAAGPITRLAAETDRAEVLQRLAEAGFETVVFCDAAPAYDGMPGAPLATRLTGKDRGWALYRLSSGRASPADG